MTDELDRSPLPSGGTYKYFKSLGKTERPLGEQDTTITQDTKTLYLAQTKSVNGVESGYVWRYDLVTGARKDRMYLPGAGHMTTIDEYNDNILCNYNHGGTRSLVSIPYQAGKTVRWGDSSIKILRTENSRYGIPALSPDDKYLLVREATGSGDYFAVYDFQALLTATTSTKALKRFGPIPTSARSFQGIAIAGPYAYILYGHTNGLAAHRDRDFDPFAVDVHEWATGKKVESRNYWSDLYDWNSKIEIEPAGLQVHPKYGLVVGMKLDYHVNSERYIGLFVGAEWRTLTIMGKAYEPIEDVSVEVLNSAREKGSFSRHVFYMQEWLKKCGFDPGDSDGYWNPSSKTQAALDAFRWAHRAELGFTDRKDGEGTIGVLSLSLLNDLARSSMKVREEK